MNIGIFENSLGGAEPPVELSPPLRALWYQAKGHWDEAHRQVQDEHTDSAAWVHAFLHRVEGDESNAGYWYRIAGRPHYNGSLSSEWREILGQLLSTVGEPVLEMDH